MNLRALLIPAGLLAIVLTAACGSGSDLVTDYPYSGLQTFDDLGRDHFASGLTYDDYNSNPPTSGPHSNLEAFRVHERPVAKETAVHNMEHAGVIIWYNCAGGPEPLSADDCATLRDNLTALVQPQIADRTHILMTPYDGMTDRIALTAWRHLDAFDEYDEARVQTFIDTFECRFDPEGLC